MGAATHIGFVQQPSSTFDSEVTLPQQPILNALDAGGAIDTSYTQLCTLKAPLATLIQRPGAMPATLNFVAGVATFTDINVSAGLACQIIATAPGLTGATSSVMTPTAVGGRDNLAELPRIVPDTTYPTITTTYTVQPGNPIAGNNYHTVQAAMDAAVNANANTHSEIIIDPGTYVEALTLNKKTSGSGWIVLRPVTMPCAQGTRAQPSMFVSGGVKIQATTSNLVIGTANGAHHFRFAGLEMQGVTATFIQLSEAGGATLITNCPDFIGFDRCYVHGTSTLDSVRAIEYGGKSLFIVDSYFADIHSAGNGDTQVIAGWNASGPLLIHNCYLEAAGEVTLFGGSDTPLLDVVTSDITITQNHFRKPLSWKRPGDGTTPAGTWISKNLTELKSGRRVLYEGNVFENQWFDAQNCAITFGSAGQYGTSPWMGVRDVTFRKNLLRNATRFFIANFMNSGVIGPITTGAGRGITTSTTGGSIPSGSTYYYKVTALFNTAGFSTTESNDDMDGDSGTNEVTVTTGAGSTNSNSITFRVTPGAIGFRIYRGTTAGGENQYVQISPPASSGANGTWTDTGALSWTAGTVPSVPSLALSTPMHRCSVHDNLAIVNNTSPYDDISHSSNVFFGGPLDDFVFSHNTIVADGETFLVYEGTAAGQRCHFDYNVFSFKHYGLGGSLPGNYGGKFTNGFATSLRNVIMDLDTNFNAPFSSYDQTWGNSTQATVGFASPTTLTADAARAASFTQLMNAATLTTGTYATASWTGDGKLVGADMTALASAISNTVVSGEGTNLAADTTGLTGPADHLTIITQPSLTSVDGVPHAIQPSGVVQDASNATVTGDTSTITATWVNETGNGTAIGTLTTVAASGVWSFAGKGLGVSSTTGCTGHWHFTDGILTAVNSATISILGDTIVSNTCNVTSIIDLEVASILVAPPSVSLSATTASATVVGTAYNAESQPLPAQIYYRSLDTTIATVNKTSGLVSLVSGSGGIVSVIGLSNDPTATHLAVTTQPSASIVPQILPTQPVVKAWDVNNTVDTAYTGSVTASLNVLSGTPVLAGISASAFTNGAASFGSLAISGSGTWNLTFNAPSVTSVTSSVCTTTVNINAPVFVSSSNLWRVDSGSGTSATYNSGTPLVIPSGLPNSALVLFINSFKVPTAVRLDNASGSVFTLAGSGSSTTDGNRSYIWVLPNPTTDGVTGHIIWVQTAYQLGEAILGVYKNVNQTTPVGSVASIGATGGTNTPFSFAPLSSSTTDRVAVCLAATSLTLVTGSGALTPVSGSPSINSGIAVAGFTELGTSPTSSVSFTTDGSHNLTGVAVVLKGA